MCFYLFAIVSRFYFVFFFFVPKCQYVGSGKYRFGLIMFKQTLKAYFKGYWPILKEMM